MKRDFEVLIGKQQREQFLETQLRLRGIYPSVENPSGAYCPVSLTGVPEPVKKVLKIRRQTLFDRILAPINIVPYDPATAPLSPDTNKDATFDEVYGTDARRIAENRFLIGFPVYPSFGFGTEADIGLSLNRFSAFLFDKNIRTARMWPPCALFLGYENLEQQANRISKVLSFMKNYSLAIGIRNDKPILLGCSEKDGDLIDMARTVYEMFPDLAYTHNPDKPLPIAEVNNPEIFYELGRDTKS